MSTADLCLSTDPMELRGALISKQVHRRKPRRWAQEKLQVTPLSHKKLVCQWLEESPLPLTLTPQEEKEIPLSIDTTLVPRCTPNSSLVADSNTKDVTKSTTTSPKANGAEDDGVDVAAGASDSEGILGETPARPVLEQQRRTLEKTTRQPSPVQPKWMGRKTITRWKLRFKLKTDRE